MRIISSDKLSELEFETSDVVSSSISVNEDENSIEYLIGLRSIRKSFGIRLTLNKKCTASLQLAPLMLSESFDPEKVDRVSIWPL